ncbi:MAG: carboxypeptidase regulatory-like domain-containing protein [Bryobacteraceae bacterium]|nr:carboxypeptidase regulatory-like domain-containing protein [Bryobacteraceae bacterium]
MKKTLSTIFACLLLLSGSTTGLLAQATYGGVSGSVRSATGTPVTDVKIELENVATGTRITVSGDPSGSYRFENVPPGRYRLITTSGRVSAVPSPEFEVTANRINTLNITIAAGPATDVVTMVEAPATETDPAQLITYWTSNPILNTAEPNLMENTGNLNGAYNLASLTDGIVDSGVGSQNGPVVTGHRPDFNYFHIVGSDNNNLLRNGSMVYLPNTATKDFVVMQGQNTPRFGHATGGKFNSTLQSGTNHVHGSAYWYNQNRILNAMENNVVRRGLDDNPRYDQNRFGGSIGFPIVRDRAFFYGNVEYIPFGFARFSDVNVYVPTAAGFGTLAALPGVSQANLNFLRNNFSTDQASTQTATVGATSIPLGLAGTGYAGYRNAWIGSGGFDFTFNPRHALKARYFHNEVDEGRRNVAEIGSNFFQPRRDRSLMATVSHNWTSGANITNELRGTFNRFNGGYTSDFPFGLNQPNIQIGQLNFFSNFGLGSAIDSIQNTFQVADTLAITTGRHNWRFGFDGRNYRTTQRGFTNLLGEYAYSSLASFLSDARPDMGANRTFIPGNRLDDQQWLYFGFVNDRWNVRQNLTIDLGVNYQYASVPNAISRANIAQFGLNRVNADRNNFAPQAGVAWSPTGTTVLRAGFNMQWEGVQRWNPLFFPFSTTLTANANTPIGGFLGTGGVTEPIGGFNTNLTSGQQGLFTGTLSGNQDLPYYMRWNVALQQSLWRGLLAEAKYLGTRGVNLPFLRNINSPFYNGFGGAPVFTTAPTQAELNALPALSQQVGANGTTNPVLASFNEGQSTYHGFTARLSQRFARGLAVDGNYTWSHLIADSTGSVYDLANPFRQRSDLLYDRRHSANVTWTFDMASAFTDTASVWRNIFANFTLSGSYIYQSPQRLPLLAGLGNTFASPAFFNAGGQEGVFGGVNPLRSAQGAIVGYLGADPNAQFFGVGGGSGRPALFDLDNMNNVNLSAAKGFGWRDRFNFEIRGTAYNLFNHAQYVGTRPGSISAASPTGLPQLVSVGGLGFNNFGETLSANRRILQLSLRMLF